MTNGKPHEIKNQNDKHITDPKHRKEIEETLIRGLDYTYIDGVKVTVVKHFDKTDDMETIVHVEGI